MAEIIRELTTAESVRNKISVWLGSSSNWGHTIKELLANSMDEVIKGNGNKIDIIRHNKNRITFIDYCQGLPLETTTTTGKKGWESLLMTLFSSSKYGDNGLEATTGTNGVFLVVLTYSSKVIEYEVARPDGKVYNIAFEKGEISKPFKVIGKSDKTYTKITFELDEDVYSNVNFQYDSLCELAEAQSSLANVTIGVQDDESQQNKVYRFEKGITEYLALLNKDNHPIIDDIIGFNKEYEFYADKYKENDRIKMSFVFQYCKEEDVPQKVFLNRSELTYGGTINEGIINGLRSAFNKQIKTLGLYKANEKQIKSEDAMLGLSFIANVSSILFEYEHQTKMSTKNPHYKQAMQFAIEEFMEIFFTESKIEGQKLCERVLVNKRSRESAENTRASVKKALQGESKSYIDIPNFTNCRSKKPEERELMIVEGKSALGAIVQGRDSKYQAIYAIRGKILSCLKKSVAQIFSNEIVMNIYRILGCGIELRDKNVKGIAPFDISKLSVDKIIIATDADLDGFSIRVLLLSMIYKLTPTLLREGKVYVVEAPLFEIHTKNKQYYAYSEEEKNDIVKGLKKYEIMRNKGLGEMESKSIYESLMNPATRRIVQITVEDVEKMEETFDLFMGTDADKRKEIIYELFDKYEEVE